VLPGSPIAWYGSKATFGVDLYSMLFIYSGYGYTFRIEGPTLDGAGARGCADGSVGRTGKFIVLAEIRFS
jgi:hypothetical protein